MVQFEDFHPSYAGIYREIRTLACYGGNGVESVIHEEDLFRSGNSHITRIVCSHLLIVRLTSISRCTL